MIVMIDGLQNEDRERNKTGSDLRDLLETKEEKTQGSEEEPF